MSEYNVSVHSWTHICVYTDVSRSCKQVVHSWLWAKLTKTSTPCGALMPACLNLASYKYKHTPGKVYISNICIQHRIYIWYQPLLKSAYLMENNLSFYSWSLRKEHEFLFSKLEFFLLQISLSPLDWAFWALVNACFVQLHQLQCDGRYDCYPALQLQLATVRLKNVTYVDNFALQNSLQSARVHCLQCV